MTRGSIREYSEAVRGRYLQASKKEKGRNTSQHFFPCPLEPCLVCPEFLNT